MQCVIHGAEEAVDACRGCGKPICAGCGDESGGAFICARCRTARAGQEERTPTPGAPGATAATEGAPPQPAPAPPPLAGQRSPALAALLSFCPGLGQLYNGEPLKALAFLSVFALLVLASVRLGPIGVFAAFFWFYQVFEAFHTALRRSRPRGPEPLGEGTAWTAWGLVALGLVAFAENLTGAVLPRLRYVLPALVILAGLRLLVSYFQTGEEARP
jgi:TM2 domain-containing membrane protein YozV